MKLNTNILILLITSMIFSCREVYTPEISTQPKILVVDGCFTDEIKDHVVYLSRTTKYDTLANIPEKGAQVYITDAFGNFYSLTEKSPGTYTSDFQLETGNRYTLHIKTIDGKTYVSDEQELLPKGNIDDFTTLGLENSYLMNVDGEIKSIKVKGAEIIINQNISAEENSYYRYENILLIEYTSSSGGITSYCWKKFNPNLYFILDDILKDHAGIFEQRIGFLPLEKRFYGVVNDRRTTPGNPPGYDTVINTLYNYYVTIKQFRFNQNVYKTYKSMNQQLAAKQKLFDPVLTQFLSNIVCESDNKEVVIGKFEVSAVNSYTFMIDSNPIINSYTLSKISTVDFDSIPSRGSIDERPPRYWIY